jgi:hypothetical protein
MEAVATVDPATREQAVARVFEPVDSARAVYRGMVLVGHRRSIPAGTMFWALPGRGFATTQSLRAGDPMFQVLIAPSDAGLVEQQGVLREILQ